MSDTSHLTKLGSPTTYQYSDPSASILEAFSNPTASVPGADQPGAVRWWAVGLDCLEFTSLCPMTGQPDFGRIHIHYVPDRLCVESKSLKLYLGAYRNHGAFHEECVNRIADDVSLTISPRYLRVFGDFAVRGGIAIRPLALRVDPGLSPADEARCADLVAQHDRLMGSVVAS